MSNISNGLCQGLDLINLNKEIIKLVTLLGINNPTYGLEIEQVLLNPYGKPIFNIENQPYDTVSLSALKSNYPWNITMEGMGSQIETVTKIIHTNLWELFEDSTKMLTQLREIAKQEGFILSSCQAPLPPEGSDLYLFENIPYNNGYKQYLEPLMKALHDIDIKLPYFTATNSTHMHFGNASQDILKSNNINFQIHKHLMIDIIEAMKKNPGNRHKDFGMSDKRFEPRSKVVNARFQESFPAELKSILPFDYNGNEKLFDKLQKDLLSIKTEKELYKFFYDLYKIDQLNFENLGTFSILKSHFPVSLKKPGSSAHTTNELRTADAPENEQDLEKIIKMYAIQYLWALEKTAKERKKS